MDCSLFRHLHDGAPQRMNARTTTQAIRLRRCTVERLFALLKYVIFGHPRFLLRGLGGAQKEISLATQAYNPKTMINVLGKPTGNSTQLSETAAHLATTTPSQKSAAPNPKYRLI